MDDITAKRHVTSSRFGFDAIIIPHDTPKDAVVQLSSALQAMSSAIGLVAASQRELGRGITLHLIDDSTASNPNETIKLSHGAIASTTMENGHIEVYLRSSLAKDSSMFLTTVCHEMMHALDARLATEQYAQHLNKLDPIARTTPCLSIFADKLPHDPTCSKITETLGTDQQLISMYKDFRIGQDVATGIPKWVAKAMQPYTLDERSQSEVEYDFSRVEVLGKAFEVIVGGPRRQDDPASKLVDKAADIALMVARRSCGLLGPDLLPTQRAQAPDPIIPPMVDLQPRLRERSASGSAPDASLARKPTY